jgi:hypothetical protein
MLLTPKQTTRREVKKHFWPNRVNYAAENGSKGTAKAETRCHIFHPTGPDVKLTIQLKQSKYWETVSGMSWEPGKIIIDKSPKLLHPISNPARMPNTCLHAKDKPQRPQKGKFTRLTTDQQNCNDLLEHCQY